jgi:hypothetical protein
MNYDLNYSEYNFIPMIDISSSMFVHNIQSIYAALTIGIMLGHMSKGTMKNKAITFSSIPILYNITGNNLNEKVNCIFNELMNPVNSYGSNDNTDFILAFDSLLDYCISNNISNEYLKKTKIIALSAMSFNKCCIENQYDESIEIIRNKFKLHGYDIPQLIFWNLSGSLGIPNSINNNVVHLNGFNSSIIDDFLFTGNITPKKIVLNVIKKYFQLVTI